MSKNIFFNNNKAKSKTTNSTKYIQNQMQINCITKVLVEHADVPPKLIEWLIQSVQENVSIEYENSLK